jgi:hypothetical protein
MQKQRRWFKQFYTPPLISPRFENSTSEGSEVEQRVLGPMTGTSDELF